MSEWSISSSVWKVGNWLDSTLGSTSSFKIPSVFGSKSRYVVNIANPLRGKIEGDFLIVSDGGCINVNIWIEQGEINNIMKSLSEQSGSQRGGGYYRGGQGGHRGSNYSGRGGSGGKQPYKKGGY